MASRSSCFIASSLADSRSESFRRTRFASEPRLRRACRWRSRRARRRPRSGSTRARVRGFRGRLPVPPAVFGVRDVAPRRARRPSPRRRARRPPSRLTPRGGGGAKRGRERRARGCASCGVASRDASRSGVGFAEKSRPENRFLEAARESRRGRQRSHAGFHDTPPVRDATLRPVPLRSFKPEARDATLRARTLPEPRVRARAEAHAEVAAFRAAAATRLAKRAPIGRRSRRSCR